MCVENSRRSLRHHDTDTGLVRTGRGWGLVSREVIYLLLEGGLLMRLISRQLQVIVVAKHETFCQDVLLLGSVPTLEIILGHRRILVVGAVNHLRLSWGDIGVVVVYLREVLDYDGHTVLIKDVSMVLACDWVRMEQIVTLGCSGCCAGMAKL